MKKIKLSFVGLILNILLIISSIILIKSINLLNVIPDKYYTIGLVVLIIVTFIICLINIFKFKKKLLKILHIFFFIISLILIVGYIIIVIYLNNTMDLFNKYKMYKEEVTNYYIVVLEDSIYTEPSDLENKTVIYYSGISEEVINSIKIDLTMNSEELMNNLKDKLFNKETDAILINDIIYNKFTEDDEEFENKTRIMKTISIKEEIEDITKRVSIKNTTFNVLISGIDSSGDINATSRNDVNIVVTVNPNTNEILLTSIPRDYYVKLHGTTGYNDKLTHASYYGTSMAVATIEDLLDIEINYYVKVNFTTVVDLVNEIGGVDIESDRDLNLGTCYIKSGWNHLNGECALAYSRCRKLYEDGDRHRGRNQQDVIISIFNQLISNPKTLLANYTNIIEVMDGKFVTNMDMSEITEFIKYELNDLSSYYITKTQLDGYGSMGETYSYPGQDLWIMIPYQDTIDSAHNLIDKMQNNISIKE